MNEELERRLAANEDVFRRVNEGIARGQWPDWAGGSDTGAPVGFRCECARLGCNTLLALSLEDYERVRAEPTWFVLLEGHELPAVERVVDRIGDILIVEKIGDAAEEAVARYPRA